MSPHEHDDRESGPDNDLAQEMLELYFDCHPEPEVLLARLERDPEAMALYREVVRKAETLSRAARAEGPARPPVLEGSGLAGPEVEGPEVESPGLEDPGLEGTELESVGRADAQPDDATGATDAASSPGDALRGTGDVPVSGTQIQRHEGAPGRPAFWGSPWRRLAAVAAAVLLVGVGFSAYASWAAREHRTFLEENLRVVVSGPRELVQGATATFAVQTSDLAGTASAAPTRWQLRRHGEVIADGALPATTDRDGRRTVQVAIGATIPDEFCVAVEGRERIETHTLRIDPSVTQPILHVSTDKPVYRPGDVVRLRCVALDRLTLQPIDAGWGLADGEAAPQGVMRSLRIDVRDPSGSVQQNLWAQPVALDASPSDVGGEAGAPGENRAPRTDVGVWQGEFTVSPQAGGGAWTLMAYGPGVRAGDADRAVEVPLQVTRQQAPRLAKRLRLDKEAYVPGQTVTARLAVQRLGGGTVAGAAVRGRVLVGGESVAEAEGTVDATGGVTLAFALPDELAGTSGRVVLTVNDDAVVESAVETFSLPLEDLDVQLYPEGGALVAGAPDRVYIEVTDPSGRPVDARGRVVDRDGRTVAPFETAHQGRGRIALDVQAGEIYRLLLDEPLAVETELPPAEADGLALRVDPVADADHLRVSLHGKPGVPLLVAAYCRGVMVGQATVLPRGAGSGSGRAARTLDLPIAPEAAGVLRVTAFEPAIGRAGTLAPVAERLVQRMPRARWNVEVGPGPEGFAALGTAERQQIAVRATRADGRPGAALLGVRVYDRSLRDLEGDRAGSLLDRALFLADVERPEDLESFFVGLADDGTVGEADSAERVDLYLGTRGWRRFAWRELDGDGEETFLAALDEGRRSVAVRATPAALPQVADSGAALDPGLWRRAREAHRAERRAEAAWLLGLVGLGLLGAVELVRALLGRVRPQGRPWAQWVTAAGGVVIAAVLFVTLQLNVIGGGQGVADMAVASDARVLGSPSAASEDWRADFGIWDEHLIDRDFTTAGAFFNDGDTGGLIGRSELLFLQAIGGGGGGGWVSSLDADQIPTDLPFDLGGSGRVFRFESVEETELPRSDDFFMEFVGRAVSPVRVYAHRADRTATERNDFTECLYWNPLLLTDENGDADFTFDTSDRLTTWTVEIDAHGGGLLGRGVATFDALQSLEMDLVVPVEVTQGDELLLPVGITARAPDAIAAGEVRIGAASAGALSVRSESGNARFDVTAPLANGKACVRLPVTVGRGDAGGLLIAAAAGPRADRLERAIRVVPRGFPIEWGAGGQVREGRAHFEVPFPEAPVEGSVHAVLRLYPSPLGMIQQGLEGLVRRPGGCFEQTSSSNYPNVLVLSLLEGHGEAQHPAAAQARSFLPGAYDRLVGFASPSGGFEWFGGDPGHLALTAYGLMQFRDMARVWSGVDPAMLAETEAWILGKRDGRGGFRRDENGHSFGQAPVEVVSAYVAWALLHSASEDDVAAMVDTLGAELRERARRAEIADDGYELALCAAALAEAGHADAGAALARLRTVQAPDGGFDGSTRSITCSGGDDLRVETTSIALLAWLRAAEAGITGPGGKGFGIDDDAARRAMEFLVGMQRGGGTFGATQATILALKALAAWSEATAGIAADGRCSVWVDGEEVGRLRFAAEQTAAAEFDLRPFLAGGLHAVELTIDGERSEMPWAFDLGYHADVPADDPSAGLSLAVGLRETAVDEGDTVALDVSLENEGPDDLGMVTAVVGLPAGLEAPQAVLDDLQAEGHFDFVERHGRELHLYWRYLEPGQRVAFAVDLLARIPGRTTGPASRAWVYYEPDRVRWVAPLEVEVR